MCAQLSGSCLFAAILRQDNANPQHDSHPHEFRPRRNVHTEQGPLTPAGFLRELACVACLTFRSALWLSPDASCDATATHVTSFSCVLVQLLRRAKICQRCMCCAMHW